MRVWVTGSGGQVGQVLLKALKKKGVDCFGTSHAETDIADEPAVRARMKEATHVVNTAAYCEVDPAETHREKAFRTNVLGPAILAKVSREMGAHLLHISTDYVFDGTLQRPYVEEDKTHPLNWYGETKREGELKIAEANPKACTVRVSWVFGGAGERNYAPRILHELQVKKELRFVDDQMSCPTYAIDLADALIVLLGRSGMYHYCNEGWVSKYGFAMAIWERAKKKHFPLVCERIVPIASSEFPTLAKRPLFTPLNTQKIKALLPIRSWQEALDDYFSHLKPSFL